MAVKFQVFFFSIDIFYSPFVNKVGHCHLKETLFEYSM